jgi:hypothetical protein
VFDPRKLSESEPEDNSCELEELIQAEIGPRASFLLNDMLWRALIHVCLRFQLEQKIHPVD